MSMTETPNETPAAPKKRKYAARRKRAAPAPEPKQAAPAEFEGISPTDCCDDCDEKGCVISGINVCGHPYKGGLQSALLNKPDVMKRYQRAKRALAGAKLDLQKMAGG